MDPETPTSGYYRSFVGNPNVTTSRSRWRVPPARRRPPPYPVMGVFNDLWTSKFVPSIQWIYDEKITNGCSATRYCPVVSGHARPDGQLPRPDDGPPGGHEGLLQRRQRQDPRSQHQQDRRGWASPAAASPARTAAGDSGQLEPRWRASWSARSTCRRPRRTTSPTTTTARSRRAINALAEAGLTGGCGNGKYCPNTAVTREQMAAFLLRAFKPELTRRGPSRAGRPPPQTAPDHPVPVVTGTFVRLPGLDAQA